MHFFLIPRNWFFFIFKEKNCTSGICFLFNTSKRKFTCDNLLVNWQAFLDRTLGSSQLSLSRKGQRLVKGFNSNPKIFTKKLSLSLLSFLQASDIQCTWHAHKCTSVTNIHPPCPPPPFPTTPRPQIGLIRNLHVNVLLPPNIILSSCWIRTGVDDAGLLNMTFGPDVTGLISLTLSRWARCDLDVGSRP